MGAKGLKYVMVDPGRAPVRRPVDTKTFSRLVKAFSKDVRERPQIFARGTSAFVEPANMLFSLPARNRREGQFEGAKTLDGNLIVDATTRHMADNGMAVAESQIGGLYQRWSGDSVELNRGELLIHEA